MYNFYYFFINNIITELARANFIFLLIMLVLYLFIRKRTTSKSVHFLGAIAPVLLIREIIFFILRKMRETAINYQAIIPFRNPNQIIYVITEAVIAILIVQWFVSYTGNKRTRIPFFIINIVLVIFVITDNLWGFTWKNTVYIDALYPHIVFLANYIILGVYMFRISIYNTSNAWHIIGSRKIFTFSIIILNIIIIIFGGLGLQYDPVLMNDIFLPAGYCIFIYLLYKYFYSFEEEEQQHIKNLQSDLDSLFDFMSNLGSAIAEKLELHQILNFITASAVKSTNAQAGTILMIDEFDSMLKVRTIDGVFPPPFEVPDRVRVKISRLEDYFRSQSIKLGETIFGEVAKTGQPVFIQNSTQDERMKYNIQNNISFVSSIIAIPLVVQKRIIGVISVIKREKDAFFTENDYDHLVTFANYASLTIDFILTYMELIEKREMERELGIAAEIQQKLLPRKLPAMKAGTLAAFSIPAKGVSGDYYDVLQFNNNLFGLIICDVAGKGVPAALIMVMIRSILHLITSAEKKASNVVTWINRGVSGKIDIDRFATLSFLTYDENTGEVIYSNAAHHPLLIFRHKTATIETVDTEGLPIGVERSAKYGQKRFTLEKGDLIVLYTDGIIEAMNAAGQQYTYEKFTKLITDNAGLAPEVLIEKIKADLSAFVGNAPQHDDQTLMLMKVN